MLSSKKLNFSHTNTNNWNGVVKIELGSFLVLNANGIVFASRNNDYVQSNV